VSRRAGDYALCGLGLRLRLDGDDRVTEARAAYISVGPTPLLVDLSEPLSTMDFEGAAEVARAAAEPEEDIHATVEYRRHLIGVLTERAARSALEHARTGSPHA
jgi:carbon-monoxide dehydrogenase medium subunit